MHKFGVPEKPTAFDGEQHDCQKSAYDEYEEYLFIIILVEIVRLGLFALAMVIPFN